MYRNNSRHCRPCIIALLLVFLSIAAYAQRPQWQKLSPYVRHIVRNSPPSALNSQLSALNSPPSALFAFVRITHDADSVLAAHGGRSLLHYGNLHIASIPVSSIAAMSRDARVLRIEANRRCQLLSDSLALQINVTPVHQGYDLPQAFTGQGVIVGAMDVGYDLSHPNFYDAEGGRCRISRFWDQLSQDTVGSPYPVGRDYRSSDAILALQHSRDGLDLEHGTHTVGIAAGSGSTTPYRGIAPDADICLVANAVSDDLPYIDSTDVYKYSFVTDALGFKYIFDYAAEQQRPCVINFSEGSVQDFYGYDQLYYEMLDSMTGPGRIIVAAVGNNALQKNYMHKPRQRHSAGLFLRSGDTTMVATLKSAEAYMMRLVSYGTPYDTLCISTQAVCTSPDSSLTVVTPHYTAVLDAYPSSYNAAETCIDLTVNAQTSVGGSPRLSLEVIGDDADVELWRMHGELRNYAENPQLDDAVAHHFVFSPASAPCVIGVGATTYRDKQVNINGETHSLCEGNDGRRVEYSSMGPTFDGRIKPDCVAPGNFIISSYSSYLYEKHPTKNKLYTLFTTHNGRQYPWGGNSGTSMAAPAVAGTIALWLQACPTLTPDDVRSLLAATCTHYDETLTYPNNEYGYGQVDAYAGLLRLLGLDAIGDIAIEHTRARISATKGTLHITLPTAAATPLRIYNLKGQPVVSTTLPAGSQEHTIQLPHLPAGVYAVSIAGGSTLIRL